MILGQGEASAALSVNNDRFKRYCDNLFKKKVKPTNITPKKKKRKK